MSEYRIKQLDNGLRIITCPMPGMESAAIGVWIGVGGRYEVPTQQGISHFIEHLLFKGSKKRSALQISKAIEGVGGAINAYTSEEYTCYLVKVRGKHQSLALDVLMDMVLNPLFNSRDIEKERLVVKEEIHMVLDHPAHHVHELVHQLMWPEHPLGCMLIGREETIDSIERSHIVDFRTKNYFPENMLISASGNVDVKPLIKDTERYLEAISNYKKPKFKIFKSSQVQSQLKILKKATEQTHVCIGLRSVKREDPDRYAVKLISTILGENMSSRLFQIIREKYGLAYDVSSHMSYFKDTGGLVISAGVKSNKLEKFVELVLQELTKIRKNSIKETELTGAKEFYEGQLALGFEKTMTRMLWMGEHLISTGKVPTTEEVLKDVQKVTVDDIHRVAGKVFANNNLNVAVIGPVDEKVKLGLNI